MLVIAHRGSSQTAPENTLPAIKKAIRDGADAIEIDVQVTADGQVIVFHDEWLSRTTNGQGFVHETSYSYIKQLDAGTWFHEKFTGTRVPLLEEVLETFQGVPIDLHIELKNNFFPYPGIEQKVIDIVRAHSLEHKVIVSSFRKDSLELCQHISPSIRRGFLCWLTFDAMYIDPEWKKLKLYSIHPHVSLLRRHTSDFQREGYRIFPYNITRRNELNLCFEYKVDGVFTNCPKRVKQIISKTFR